MVAQVYIATVANLDGVDEATSRSILRIRSSRGQADDLQLYERIAPTLCPTLRRMT